MQLRTFGGPFVVPPRSAETGQNVRDAFAEMTQDPQFLKQAEKIGLKG